MSAGGADCSVPLRRHSIAGCGSRGMSSSGMSVCGPHHRLESGRASFAVRARFCCGDRETAEAPLEAACSEQPLSKVSNLTPNPAIQTLHLQNPPKVAIAATQHCSLS